jgi:hypothetical protein
MSDKPRSASRDEIAQTLSFAPDTTAEGAFTTRVM